MPVHAIGYDCSYAASITTEKGYLYSPAIHKQQSPAFSWAFLVDPITNYQVI